MSKVSDEFHKTYYAHHDTLASSHAVMKSHAEPGSPEHTHHAKAHEAHITARDYHKSCMEKAAGDEMNKADGAVPASLENLVRSTLVKLLGDMVVPSGVSGVTPDNPRFRAVPRAGQQQIPETPIVDERFAHLIKVEDGSDAPGVA